MGPGLRALAGHQLTLPLEEAIFDAEIIFVGTASGPQRNWRLGRPQAP